MMKKKIIRFLWVILLMICSFTLGYTLKPTSTASNRAAAFRSGKMPMPSGMRQAPPLQFQRRR